MNGTCSKPRSATDKVSMIGSMAGGTGGITGAEAAGVAAMCTWRTVGRLDKASGLCPSNSGIGDAPGRAATSTDSGSTMFDGGWIGPDSTMMGVARFIGADATALATTGATSTKGDNNRGCTGLLKSDCAGG
ncbi:hypothetical protein D3C76_1162170 [compost metagenome]